MAKVEPYTAGGFLWSNLRIEAAFRVPLDHDNSSTSLPKTCGLDADPRCTFRNPPADIKCQLCENRADSVDENGESDDDENDDDVVVVDDDDDDDDDEEEEEEEEEAAAAAAEAVGGEEDEEEGEEEDAEVALQPRKKVKPLTQGSRSAIKMGSDFFSDM